MASVYPGSLDSFSTSHADGVSEIIHAATVNDLADAANKIEAELGVNPKGTYATVVARLNALSNGSVPFADYVIGKSGGNTTAVSPTGQAAVSSNADAGTVIQACITNLGSTGGSIFIGPGTYTFTTTPQIPVNLTGGMTILGAGVGITVIQPASGKRAFDVGRTADYQTLKNIELGHFTVDMQNSVTGGNHVIIGNYVGGVTTSGQRLNIDGLYLHDITTINVHSEAGTTNHFPNVYFYITEPGGGSAVTLKGIKFERIICNGGNGGLVVGGAATNITVVDCRYIDCFHDRGLNEATTSSTTLNNFQIGSLAYVKFAWIERCRGYDSGDCGVEVDNFDRVWVIDCHMENSVNQGYFPTNISTGVDSNLQRAMFSNCTFRRTGTMTSLASRGWTLQDGGGGDMGSIELYGCSVFADSTCQDYGTSSAPVICGGVYASVWMRRLVIHNFNYVGKGWTYNGTYTAYYTAIRTFFASTGKPQITLDFKDLSFYVSGTNGSTGALISDCMMLDGSNMALNIQGLSWAYSMTGISPGWTRAFVLGFEDIGSNTTQVITGSIKKLWPVSISGDTSPRVGTINEGNRSATAVSGRILLEDWICDNLSAGGNELFIGANTKTAAVVQVRNVRFKTAPGVSTITPSGSPYNYQSLNQYPETVAVSGGTVSLIELSRDGTTYVTTGLTSGAFRIEPGEYIRVTYTVAPTMKGVPITS